MASGSLDPIFISIKCGCGAALLIDVSPRWTEELQRFQQIAEAWIKAHGPHFPGTHAVGADDGERPAE